jgi:ADP-ribosylglycohydrolase
MKPSDCILGSFAGDIIGSAYEFDNTKSVDFEFFRKGTFFTDDSVLTAATMDVLLSEYDYAETYQEYGQLYPHRSYGGNFRSWIYSHDTKPSKSWGNGSAMRVSPVGWYGNSIDDVLAEAKKSAEVTHNHPEGIKGAQAVAASVYLARTGKTKNEIKHFTVDTFGYNLDRTLDKIRPTYDFDVSCQGSVPEAIIAFLESSDFENAIRLAVSIGGDSDTIACITGGIAEAFYKTIPEYIAEMVSIILGPDLRIDVIIPFSEKYAIKRP